MKSSERAAWPIFAGLLVLGAAVALIGWSRTRLVERYQRLRVTSDVLALPSPEQTVVMSLGYRAALADLLYANMLVSYGIHFQEKRRFEFVGEYLDIINELDPKFATPYRFADTLLTLQPVAPRQEDYRKARAVLERGMREFPYDAELWNLAGQFLAYLAPAHLKNPAEKQEFRLEGARRLARACEIIGANENIPYHCITAAGLLTRSGEQEATRRFLERVLAVTDDEEIRKLALGYLEHVTGEQERERTERRYRSFNELWRKDLPQVRKNQLLVLGPPLDTARCAGLERGQDPSCAGSWREWSRRNEPDRAPTGSERLPSRSDPPGR